MAQMSSLKSLLNHDPVLKTEGRVLLANAENCSEVGKQKERAWKSQPGFLDSRFWIVSPPGHRAGCSPDSVQGGRGREAAARGFLVRGRVLPPRHFLPLLDAARGPGLCCLCGSRWSTGQAGTRSPGNDTQTEVLSRSQNYPTLGSVPAPSRLRGEAREGAVCPMGWLFSGQCKHPRE